MGAVKINYGLLHLDGGALDRAGAEAAEAYVLGEEKRDHILMARARILQCMIEESKFEEQIEDAEDPEVHARRAQEFAGEAVEMARKTQNRRLLARAYVWRGLSFSNDVFNNSGSGARVLRCRPRAAAPGGRARLHMEGFAGVALAHPGQEPRGHRATGVVSGAGGGQDASAVDRGVRRHRHTAGCGSARTAKFHAWPRAFPCRRKKCGASCTLAGSCASAR